MRNDIKEPIFSLPPFKTNNLFITNSQTIDWGLDMLNIPNFWRYSKGEGIKVAILDTGIAINHPDLRHAIIKCKDFTNSISGIADTRGHGTHCAGIIAACDNSLGIVGVAPEAKLLIGKVLNDNGSGNAEMIAEGIWWAIEEDADVISMSIGSPYKFEIIETALYAAIEKGVHVICAAGNSGPYLGTVEYPGAYDSVITVGSIDRRQKIASYSSRGKEVDIVAPGDDILSCYPPNGYATLSGTSMATPFVAGVAALILAKHRNFGGSSEIKDKLDLLNHLRYTALDLGDIGFDEHYGYGLINPQKLFTANIKNNIVQAQNIGSMGGFYASDTDMSMKVKIRKLLRAYKRGEIDDIPFCDLIENSGMEEDVVYEIIDQELRVELQTLEHSPAKTIKLPEHENAWENWLENIAMYDIVVIPAPKQILELVGYVKDAHQRGTTVHCVGSGHSFSDITLPKKGGYLILPHETLDYVKNIVDKNFEDIDCQKLTQLANLYKNSGLLIENLADADYYFEVKYNAKIRVLNCQLDKIGKALPVLGGFDGQTIMGVVSTSTHGSRHDLGPIPSMVASICLVTKDGEIWHVEPASAPITDKTKFQTAYGDTRKLIQDDDYFKAILVNMGCMGIVYSIVIKTVDSFYINECRMPSTWKQEKEYLKQEGLVYMNRLHDRQRQDGEKGRTLEYSLIVNPYGKQKCISTKRVKSKENKKPTNAKGIRSFPEWCDKMLKWMGVNLGILDGLTNPKRKKFPEANLNLALGLIKDPSYIDKSYEVLVNSPNQDFRGFALEIATPFDGVNHKHLDVIDRIFALMKEYGERPDDKKRLFVNPVAIRFVNKCDAYLSPQTEWQTKDPSGITVMIEILLASRHQKKTPAPYIAIKEDKRRLSLLLDLFVDLRKDYSNLRIHWGLHGVQNEDDIKLKDIYTQMLKTYPDFKKWLNIYHELNPKGVFSNSFTERMGIDCLNSNPHPSIIS